MIPPLDPNGHLPPGRHPATLAELEQAFVTAFPDSTTRQRIWAGFLAYLGAWTAASKIHSIEPLMSIWIGGSFVSSKTDPSDIDVSPVVNGDELDKIRSKPGSGAFRRLIGHRDDIVKEFMVEPFPIEWRPIRSSLSIMNLTPFERKVLSVRGGLDAWWTRTRPPGPPAPPIPPTYFAERGYVEVSL